MHINRHIVLDFETANPDSKLLKQGGAWRYAEDPLTEILCLVFAYDPAVMLTWRPEQQGYREQLQRLADDPNVLFVSHGGFEIAIWRRIMVEAYGFPDVPDDRWHDTMAVCGMKAIPLALEHAVEALHLTVQKDMDGRKHTLALSKNYDRSESAIARVIDYCAVDVKAEWILHREIGWLPKDELMAFRLHQKMNHRGVRVDLPFIRKAREVVTKAEVPLAERFEKLTGLRHTQTRELAKKFGFANAKGKLSFDAATIIGALENAFLFPEDRKALEIRQLIGSASIKKLQRMADCASLLDRRVRGGSQFHGTTPGRSAGRLFQWYNFPRGVLKDVTPEQIVDAIMTGDPDYVQTVLGAPPIKAVSSGLRHAIVPDKGKIFLAGDYKQIQARSVLAWAGQHDRLTGKHMYIAMAEEIYGRPIDKEKDLAEYTMGKSAVLGLGFGMGWPKFKAQFAPTHSDEFCQEVVRIYREEFAPKVVKLWYALERASVLAMGGRVGQLVRSAEGMGLEIKREDAWLTIRVPSGRKLWYYKPKAVPKVFDNQRSKLKTISNKFDIVAYQTVKGHTMALDNLFGGKLCENIIMAMEVDIQRHGWGNCERNGFPIVLEVYDQLVAEVPEKGADLKGFVQCMTDAPEWAKHIGIPVEVDPWDGYRYKK